MFDVGFSEMLVIAIVALVVIGPERLPAVARTVGTLLGRVRRYANDVKAEVNRELQLEEVRKMQQQLAEQAKLLERGAQQEIAAVESEVAAVGAAVADSVTPPPATAAQIEPPAAKPE